MPPLSTKSTPAHKSSQKRAASTSSSEESRHPQSLGKYFPCSSKPTLCRKTPSLSSGSDESDSNECHANTTQLHLQHHLGAKPNSSWTHQKNMNAHAKLANFKPNDICLAQFQCKIKNDDPHVEFDLQDTRRVRCSSCATWIVMRQLYDLRWWKDHRRSARCQVRQQRGLINQSIHVFFTKDVVNALTAIPPISDKVPCPGLVETEYSEMLF